MLHTRRWGRARLLGAGTAIILATVGVSALESTTAHAVGADAVSSTTNIGWPTSPGNGYCLNGGPNAQTSDPVNCNAYQAKEDVWLSGLTAGLDPGDWYFYVSSPGNKDDLSINDSSLPSRSFTVNPDETFSYSYVGSDAHALDPATGKLQVAPFDDTANPGGVYILHVCSVATGHCKNDAFHVRGGTTPPVTTIDAPGLEKTAVATHHRKVHWAITKTVDGKTYEQIDQAGPATLHYSIGVTKTVDYDVYSVTGDITATNTNASTLPVTISETGIAPDIAGQSCTLDLTGNPTSVDVVLDAGSVAAPSTYTVSYTCTFTGVPDASTQYVNGASVTYDGGSGPNSNEVDALSDLFTFPAATEDGAPESVTVTDPNAPAGSGFPQTATDSATYTYTKTVFNSNCAEYDNTATITETGQHADTTVIFCGPNNGGLTMGWWQNKNGQALLKANVNSACGTVNGYLPGAPMTPSALNYLPNAYEQNKTFNNSKYNYLSGQCTTAGTNSYLPTFDVNVFTSANAAGTGTMMVEGQWLTTALDTNNYGAGLGAGVPTLKGTQKVLIPTALQSGLGLNACDSVSNLLTQAAAQYANYSASKTLNVTPALITLLNALNNNQAVTCQ